MHQRSVRVQTYMREDGLLDMEAELIDIKGYDYPASRGMHPAGEPVHHMHLRVTIDDDFTIVDAEAAYAAAPFGQGCSAIAPAYAGLIGMNLLRGFRQQVKARFGRVAGCTHMSELTHVLPTVAIQSLAQQRQEARAAGTETERPFQLDGCHALRVDGSIVQREHPRWYMVPAGGRPNDLEVEMVGLEPEGAHISPSSDS